MRWIVWWLDDDSDGNPTKPRAVMVWDEEKAVKLRRGLEDDGYFSWVQEVGP